MDNLSDAGKLTVLAFHSKKYCPKHSGDNLKYFAYGSNMSLLRLQERVPSAKRLGSFYLQQHQLCFHKVSDDGSGKCDAFQPHKSDDVIIGALFEMHANDKAALDQAEGLGYGYNEKNVHVRNHAGDTVEAFLYYAIKIDSAMKPYSWYANHVITGALEINVPVNYLERIKAVETIEDPDKQRDAKQRALYR
ncbi:gamma-glutamylcyclotransferase family protein [Thalassotalea sp. PLHSN55]|uniref:gamma-glutamylcyclotransferase family protein n=1 Tax=Thalassotalea sp. PLHSN55 TaxID=3435888 RepID=UPI003F83E68A